MGCCGESAPALTVKSPAWTYRLRDQEAAGEAGQVEAAKAALFFGMIMLGLLLLVGIL